ncbi:GntR family transcriptional regulator [Rhodobacter sp. KR11]|jgi:DNA-binding GntR family transcriptional regulator|uniref:GntR family transcriptional regulator n=1 Tax=Rhodobacter sp. KR11 TaxID=2974588 RepID=UPI0022238730|nr:GntR family transcriptional regulator [Rhodobacter sp. KR11]MCW1917696.1 GntR family transcriptional regulator [Rhodobacter sp. KR11]
MTETRKIPTHEVTYVRLRDMILFGSLAPGQPVTIQGLVQDLSAGMTPVREAIRRLAAEGALMPQGNRRVTVPRLDPGLLGQIAFARLTLEPHLAELAARKASPALIATLEAHDARVDAAIKAGDIHAYLESNHAFHFALYDAAGAGVLTDMAQSLWLRFGPSLRFVIERGGASGLPDLHEEMLSAMVRGDAPGVARAMRADIDQGVEQVRAALEKGEI